MSAIQEIAAQSDPSGLRRQQILLEQLRTLFKQLPVVMVIAPVGAASFVFLQKDVVAQTIWLPWLIVALIINGIGSGLLYALYRRIGSLPEQADRLQRTFVFYSVISGLVWGAAGLLFLPVDSLDHQLLTFVWLWALAAMIMGATMSVARVFHAFVYLLLLPLAARSAFIGDTFHITMGATTLVYMSGLVFMYRYNHQTFIEAITLRFQNVDLIEQLRRKKDEAEQANRVKSQFLAAASHDLRQPVHAQGLFIAELDEHIEDPRGRRVLAGLENSVDALRRLLNAILDIARLDAGVVTLHIQEFPIAVLLEEVHAEYLPLFHDQGIELHVVPSSVTVRSDRVLLGQILKNFVANALRYTPRGRVLLGCRRRPDRVRIEVWDTGIGIAADQNDAIFGEFYQIGNPERDRDKGLGLGLAIVRRISHLLGHKVTVRSTPARGSVFCVEVPSATAGRTMNISSPEYIDLAGVNILLIEDEVLVSDAMQGLLTRWGCRVLSAVSAEDALKKLASWPYRPGVIVADYRLRNRETGTMAIQNIRKAFACDIPAIIVTGDTAAARIQEAFRNNDPVLHKPVHPDLLRTSIANVCGLYPGEKSGSS